MIEPRQWQPGEGLVNEHINSHRDAIKELQAQGAVWQTQLPLSRVNGLLSFVPGAVQGLPIFLGIIPEGEDITEESTQVTLAPCDATGALLGPGDGSDNVDVYLMPDQSGYTPANGTSLAEGTIIPYVMVDEVPYVLGSPVTVLTDFNVDTTYLKLQVKTRDNWGWFHTTESDWVDKHTGDACA